jgi:hypothetical protein
LSLWTRTVGRSLREYNWTRVRLDYYGNAANDQYLPVWEVDRKDHHRPAWRTALLFTQQAAEQEGGPTERDYLYGPLYLEADAPSFELGRDALVAALHVLNRDFHVPFSAIKVYFSGNRGPWALIEPGAFGVLPSAHLHQVYRSMVADLVNRIGPGHRGPDGKPYLDTSIYSWMRLRRAVNSIHQKTGLYAIPLTWRELISLVGDQVRELARGPRFMVWDFGGVAEIPEAASWYTYHVGRCWQERKSAELEAERRRRRGPRYFVGLRKCVQALLHIPGRVPLTTRNHAIYGIALALRDAGYSLEEATETCLTFYEEHCDRHPNGKDDTPVQIRATVKSAYSERRRFSERVFVSLFGELIKRSNLPEVVKIPRAEMERLFRLRATAEDWKAFFREWASRESPTDCQSYVMLDRSFVDITLPRLIDGAVKTFAYLLYASSFRRIHDGAGRWAYRIHDYVTKDLVCARLGLKAGTVGRHLAILRRLRIVHGQWLNPLPIPLTTIQLPAELAPSAPAKASISCQTEDLKALQAAPLMTSRPFVTSLSVSGLAPVPRIRIALRAKAEPLGRHRKRAALASTRRAW